MGWSDRLRRLAAGDPQRRAVEQLLAAYRRCTTQQARLAAAAAEAPNAGAESALQELAAQAGRRADALAGALRERGAGPSATPAEAMSPSRNHWERLVAALEASRGARADLQGKTPELLELDPALAGPVGTVLHGLNAELVELRTLIARADPQAWD